MKNRKQMIYYNWKLMRLQIYINNNDEISSKLPQSEDEFLFNDEDVEEPYPEIERFIKAYTSDLTMLNSMTMVKDIFIKYNAALPSSASVERLFSQWRTEVFQEHMQFKKVSHPPTQFFIYKNIFTYNLL